MSAKRIRKISVVMSMVLLSATLQSCGVIEDVFRGLARTCEQPVFVVTKTVDTNDGICTSDDCSLREAIITANNCPGHQTIQLPAGGYRLTLLGAGEDAALTGDLDITDDLTIQGEGVPSIHGQDDDRTIDVHGGDRSRDADGWCGPRRLGGLQSRRPHPAQQFGQCQ